MFSQSIVNRGTREGFVLLPTVPLRSVALKKNPWAGGILRHWHTVM